MSAYKDRKKDRCYDCAADAFAEHAKQKHFARLGELKSEYVEETVIEKYEV